MKSIKFKLAILFTIILFVFSGLIILAFNIAINNYLSTKTPAPSQQTNTDNNMQPQTDKQPPINSETLEQQKVRALYSNNLENIQKISVLILLPLALISFGMGYVLAGIFLSPLNELSHQIDKLKSENLGTQIKNIPQNEVGEIMKSFNDMSLRLQNSFDQQARFVQDASHELRTPLTVVRTNIDTVLDDKNASTTELRKSMRDALAELDEVTELANDLLTLSKPQSNKRSRENLNSVVGEHIRALEDFAKINSVKLIFTPYKESIHVLINKSEINRAVKNIIDNAIKYSKKSATPTVNVNISIDKKNKTAKIDVIDNGDGIPPHDLEKIFDRFYRVDKSRDRQTGGFGLGLSIAKKIILEHDGQINVKSKPGQTKFSIQLPIKFENEFHK